MNIIRRDVFVIREKLPNAIQYVQGTDTVPIYFKFRDITFQAGTKANVYIRKPSGKEVYDTAIINVEDNSVTVDITKQMSAEVGISDLQIELQQGNKVLYSFMEHLEVKRSIVAINSETGSSIMDEYIKKINELVTIALNAAQEKGDYAKTQGDYAKSQGDYAKTQGDYAKEKGDYAKTEAISVRAEFEDLKETLAGTENGALLLEIQKLLDDMYRIATDADIDGIIDGTYTDIDDSGSIFESGTDQDIDDILGGTFVDEPEPGGTDDEEIQNIVDSLFK